MGARCRRRYGEPPQRIEFFGNLIESIRTFDVETQISTGPGERAELAKRESP